MYTAEQVDQRIDVAEKIIETALELIAEAIHGPFSTAGYQWAHGLLGTIQSEIDQELGVDEGAECEECEPLATE